MKRTIIVLTAMLMFLFTATGSYAVEEMITVAQKPITVTYNGDDILFADALPFMQNGRSLVPARAIMERAQLNVSFDGDNRLVTATKDDLTITMHLGHKEAKILRGNTSESVFLEEPPCIINNRTYVPIRFIAEALGTKVNWNPYAREVVIIDLNEWQQEISENSSYLNLILNTPFAGITAQAENEAGSIQLDYTAKNLPSENGSHKNQKATLSLDYSSASVCDGSVTGTYTAMHADFSQLHNIDANLLKKLFPKADAQMLHALAKRHSITLDLIKDAQGNMYGKSPAFISLIENGGQQDLSKKIGEHYVYMEPAEFLSLFLDDVGLANFDKAKNGVTTPWQTITTSILEDDMLYSSSVRLMDSLLELYGKLFSNNWLTITKQWDGTDLWKLTPDSDVVTQTALEISRLMDEMAGKPWNDETLAKQKELADKTECKLTMKITLKKEKAVKSETALTMHIKGQPIPDLEGATRNLTLNLNKGNSYRQLDVKNDRIPQIPKNIIPFSALQTENAE